jgi:hypothetical protein
VLCARRNVASSGVESSSREAARRCGHDDVARWAATAAPCLAYGGWNSFELDTAPGNARHGARHATQREDHGTAPRDRSRASACAGLFTPGALCYQGRVGYCAIHQGIEQWEPCGASFSCAPGLGLRFGPCGANGVHCQPYCDIANPAAKNGCQEICPNRFFTLTSMGKNIAGLCHGT